LEILEETLGWKRAPYFGPDLEYPNEGRSVWEGHRGIEEYAQEAFLDEEYANGLRYMVEDDGMDSRSEANGFGESTPPVTPGGSSTPVRIAAPHTPFAHPESGANNFFVGSC
jgi:hypothetical protein